MCGTKKKTVLDLILNTAIVLSTVWAVAQYYTSGPDALGSVGHFSMYFFTTDSNILVAVASLLLIFWDLRDLKNGPSPCPKALMILKYAGTVAVTLTLMTVVFFLAPSTALMSGRLSGYFMFFAGNTFALHFSTPVLAILSVLLEREPALSLKESLWGLLPTFLYACVYTVMVAFLKKWPDWYGFTFGGKMYLAPFSIVAMHLATFAISSVLRKLRKESTR